MSDVLSCVWETVLECHEKILLDGGKYRIFTNRGNKLTHFDLIKFIKLISEKGAGEVLLNFIDRDGQKTGFDIKLLKERNSIAVVGTRKCSKYGTAIAKGVSSFFALNGINVVSGLALGIDTIAHEQSLASHGNTTAVLIDIMSVSPSSNSELAQRIAKNNGLLLSENLPGTPPEKYHYVARNRLQVALSKIVFIIEASNKSGTKATAEHAIKQGKQIYCPEVSIIADYPESIYEESLNKSLIEGNKAKTFTKDAYNSILEGLLL